MSVIDPFKPIPLCASCMVFAVSEFGVLSPVSIITPNSFKSFFTKALFLAGIFITSLSINKYKILLRNQSLSAVLTQFQSRYNFLRIKIPVDRWQIYIKSLGL